MTAVQRARSGRATMRSELRRRWSFWRGRRDLEVSGHDASDAADVAKELFAGVECHSVHGLPPTLFGRRENSLLIDRKCNVDEFGSAAVMKDCVDRAPDQFGRPYTSDMTDDSLDICSTDCAFSAWRAAALNFAATLAEAEAAVTQSLEGVPAPPPEELLARLRRDFEREKVTGRRAIALEDLDIRDGVDSTFPGELARSPVLALARARAPLAEDVATLARALRAVRGERHLLAEKLFRSIQGRGLGVVLQRRLSWKCAFLRSVFELSDARACPGRDWHETTEERRLGTQRYWLRRTVREALNSESPGTRSAGGELEAIVETTVEAPLEQVVALLNETDLATMWAPWSSCSELAHDLGGEASGSGDFVQKLFRVRYLLPWPFSRGVEILCYAFGSVALEERGVIVGGAQAITDATHWWGYELPAHRDPRVDVKLSAFILKPEGATRTKLTLVLRVDVPPMPRFLDGLVEFLVRKALAQLVDRWVDICGRFSSTPYAARVRDNPRVYNYVREVLREHDAQETVEV
eukprot:TRINITY_DN7171_c0_g1_i3.p1 TRINITY_DN7171_c0_g1~~TRINITY_DN7171_c0_g1_i3.p1  ORF type:complete len:524 (+),score=119.77 TRINITY_DN7171_c0_g1_i3:110-1681(+)